MVIDKYEAEASADNISNWIMLLKNVMYNEMILVGQHLEVPTHVSLKVRGEHTSPWGERLSPSERRILEGRPPRTGEDTSQNRLRVHKEVLASPKGNLNPNDILEIRLMREKDCSLHNLDPKCKNCVRCELCYFPNHIRSHDNEGRIQIFMNDVEILKTEDGNRVFQCKFIFNKKLRLLEDNR